jgi:hypothetical protein
VQQKRLSKPKELVIPPHMTSPSQQFDDNPKAYKLTVTPPAVQVQQWRQESEVEELKRKTADLE